MKTELYPKVSAPASPLGFDYGKQPPYSLQVYLLVKRNKLFLFFCLAFLVLFQDRTSHLKIELFFLRGIQFVTLLPVALQHSQATALPQGTLFCFYDLFYFFLMRSGQHQHGNEEFQEKSSCLQYCRAKDIWDMDMDFQRESLVSAKGWACMPTNPAGGWEKYLFPFLRQR